LFEGSFFAEQMNVESESISSWKKFWFHRCSNGKLRVWLFYLNKLLISLRRRDY